MPLKIYKALVEPEIIRGDEPAFLRITLEFLETDIESAETGVAFWVATHCPDMLIGSVSEVSQPLSAYVNAKVSK
jgi:hypothetical protein